VAKAEEADGGNEEEAGFDEEFAAVGPSYGRIFQVGIGEEAMPKKGSGCEVNGEMERLPKKAAKTKAHIGSDHDKREQVEGDGADGVIERLGGRVDGVDEIEDAEARSLVEEENGGMKDCDA